MRAFTCGFVAFLSAFSCVLLRAADKPNVLLIVADDLGYSDLGCYGGEIQTPNLDKLASGGMRLTRFYNTGRCCPSRASILTGHYPHRVGLGHMVQDLGQPGYRGRVSDGAPTIAQVLQPAGYRCFIAGKWHLGTEDPTKHGFEEFYGTLVSAKTFWDPDHFLRLPADHPKREYEPDSFYGTDAVTDHALEFLKLARQTPDKPWFLYLAYNAPHFPLHAPPAKIAKYAEAYHLGWDKAREQRLARMKKLGVVPQATELTPRSQFWDWGEEETGRNPAWSTIPADRRADLARRMAIYAAMVDSMDENIGRVIADLRAERELDNTLLIFFSDNGACAEWDPFGFDIKSSPNNILHRDEMIEAMGRVGTFHSVGSGWANASNTPWRLYKHYNHEGGINSPCIIHWPARMKSAGTIEGRATHIIDLMPTVLAATSATYTGDIKLPGVSLTKLIRGTKMKSRPLFFEHEGNRAVMDGPWKLVAIKERPWELYDLSKDRTELNNLAREHPAEVKRLSEMWRQWALRNHVLPLPKDYRVGYLKTARNSSAAPKNLDDANVRFERMVLTDTYFCDGVTSGDINGDGKADIVAGPFWYEGPDFTQAHEFYKAVPIPTEPSPSNSMFSFVHDFNGDGRQDILVLGRVHKHEAKWYENPGDKPGLWKSHIVFERVRGESPTLVDLDGDGVPQIICHWDGRWGWIQPDPKHPYEPWKFQAVGDDEGWSQFYHGEGVGDIDGDDRLDLIINDGWYQQPVKRATSSNGWKFHRHRFSKGRGGAQMFAYDVDGDGDRDVISSVDAHGWGLAWYEHMSTDAGIRFREHLIMGDRTQESEFGVAFTQPHALQLADINGDGLTDIITGKRRWAHGPKGDIEPNAAPVVYWFELSRGKEGGVRYIPHRIDDNSGCGVQICVKDVDEDGRPDVMTASKLGTFLFLNREKTPGN